MPPRDGQDARRDGDTNAGAAAEAERRGRPAVAMFRDGPHRAQAPARSRELLVEIPLDGPWNPGALAAALVVPERARGVVLFAHGSVPCDRCPRDAAVARALEDAGFATLLVDLLTGPEADDDVHTGRYAVDLGLFGARIAGATRWLWTAPATRALRVGYFAAGAGAAAALATAAELPRCVDAVVSCGGRVDLVDRSTLARVRAPVLLIEGTAEAGPRASEKDERALGIARTACELLPSARLAIVRSATHWFGEPDAFATVARLAVDWCASHLAARAARR